MAKKCACEKRAERRTLITIKQPVKTRDAGGEPVEGAPTTIGTAWVRAHNLHGREQFEAAQLYATASTKFFGDYADLGSVTTDMYVEPEGDTRRYNVLHVDNVDFQNREVVLLTEVHGN